jgi:hypothetical protein
VPARRGSTQEKSRFADIRPRGIAIKWTLQRIRGGRAECAAVCGPGRQRNAALDQHFDLARMRFKKSDAWCHRLQIIDWQLRDIVLLARSKTSLAWEWDTVELNAFIKMNAAQLR